VVPLRPRPARRVRRLRARLPRRAVPWWFAAVALAALTGIVVHGTLAGALDARARWGRTRPVLVATRAIAPGGAVDAGATEVRLLPVALVPPGALRTLPSGRVAVAAVARGEAVLASRVSGQAEAGIAALLPAGTRALVIPVEVAGLPVRVGDRVDLLAAGGGGPEGDLPVADGAVASGASGPVAAGALVVAVLREALVVAVKADDAVAVAAALGQGPLVPALRSP